MVKEPSPQPTSSIREPLRTDNPASLLLITLMVRRQLASRGAPMNGFCGPRDNGFEFRATLIESQFAFAEPETSGVGGSESISESDGEPAIFIGNGEIR